ncbi:MAG: ABC transporter ATP-binding protein [Pseudomonas sp.]
MSTLALEVKNLEKVFGAFQVTRDVCLNLPEGARHALIGPNGAGKTTLVHQISGLLKPTRGSILLCGQDITQASPAQRTKGGMARTFQINSLFSKLTVAENIGIAVAARHGIEGSMGRPLTSRYQVMDEVVELLQSLSLTDLASKQIAELAYGQRRLVEIALALATKPAVLLLDEPVAGVPTTEGKRLFEMFERLPERIAVLVIEHDMNLVFNFARTITVMVEGAVLVEGPTRDIRTDERVRDVYLGKRHA